ncbi:MAG: tyrosine--tRNA ligase [Acidimicrobiia bacterium]
MPEPLDSLLQGVDQAIPTGELAKRLSESRSLRVKLGMDPTAPNVTLGWAVVLRKLRQFQEHGHTAVLIVGDFTAQVGDPSEMSETRRRLSAEEVGANADRLLEGFRRILLPEPLEIRYNSEWLSKLDMNAVLELTSKVTVAQLLERDDFRTRFEEERPISLMEFLYPLLQAMDSVAIEADVELGGSDQLWNLLTGRDIQQRYGKTPQVVITVPLLVGTDGVQKMSQSFGNYIAIDDDPLEMFGKIMSLPDEAMGDYYRLATDLEASEREDLLAGLENQTVHPGEAKRRLGREVVGMYWDPDAAEKAEGAFDRVHKEHQVPEDVPEHALGVEDPVYLPILLREAGLVTSSSEGKRLIAQGAVKIEGEAVSSDEISRSLLVGRVLQAGKRRFVRVVG